MGSVSVVEDCRACAGPGIEVSIEETWWVDGFKGWVGGLCEWLISNQESYMASKRMIAVVVQCDDNICVYV
jgi:hypothetical protein